MKNIRERTFPDWFDGYDNANGLSIHYYRTGGDKPPVVLNHGAMDDSLCWTPVGKELERNFDVIMFDTRGHGLSESGKGDYSPEARAKDLAEAINALGLAKPIVGGHSLGAEVSMRLAALYPDIPGALFLEDPPIAMPGEPVFKIESEKQGMDVIKMLTRIVALVKILPVFSGKILAKRLMPDYSDEEILAWIHSKKRVDKDFLDFLAAEADPHAGIFDAAKRIKVPTLLMYGDREAGAIVSKKVVQELGLLIPGLQAVHFEGANHDIRRSEFDEYINVLKAFLNKTAR